jgi:DNA-binding XRE family transcriptional regulator
MWRRKTVDNKKSLPHIGVSNPIERSMEMEMKINANLLKQERNKRAWSQEHLAQVTGLGLRTIQRIESSGMASNESIASIATVLEMTVADFVGEGPNHAGDFEIVRTIGTTLPDVKDASTRLGVALKFKGRLLACVAIDNSAEPNSLMVSIGHKRRDALLAQKPDVYYLTGHYAPYPAILVRLSLIKKDALKNLLTESWEFMREEAA